MTLSSLLREDLAVSAGSGAGFRRKVGTILLERQFQLTALARVAHAFHARGSKTAAKAIRWVIHVLFGCDVHPGAEIGKRVQFPHPVGIVIGAGAVIGSDVTIFQGVTLGSHGVPGKPKQYPSVGDGSILYAGAFLIGGVKVGDGAVIGAQTLITSDVADREIVTSEKSVCRSRVTR